MAALSNSRPRVGACVMVEHLEADPALRDFLISGERDVEVQDFLLPDVIRHDLGPLIQRAQAALDGHRGRLGIHGPFSTSTWTPKIPTSVI